MKNMKKTISAIIFSFLLISTVNAKTDSPVIVKLLDSSSENISLLIWPDITTANEFEGNLIELEDFKIKSINVQSQSISAAAYVKQGVSVPVNVNFSQLVSLYQSQLEFEKKYQQKAFELLDSNLSQDEFNSKVKELASEYQLEELELWQNMLDVRSKYVFNLPIPKDDFIDSSLTVATTFQRNRSNTMQIQETSTSSFSITSESSSDLTRALIIDVDGLRADTLYDNIDNLSNIKQDLIQRGTRFDNVTCIFPSITLASQASIVTGNFPDTMGITGNKWFEPKTQTFRKYWVDVWYDPITWSGKANRDIFSDSEMIYEAANDNGYNTTVIFHHYHKTKSGSNRWNIPDPLQYVFFKANQYRLVDHTSTFAAKMQLYWYPSSTQVLMVYLPGLDEISHDSGPDAQKDYVSKYVDSNIGSLINALKSYGFYNQTLITLVSDHGHYDTSNGINLDDLEDDVRDAGYVIMECYPLGIHCRDENQAGASVDFSQSNAVVAPNGGMTQIYVRGDGDDWGDLPDFSDLEPLLEYFDDNDDYLELLLFANHSAGTYQVYVYDVIYSLEDYFAGEDDYYPSTVTRLKNFYSNRSGDVIIMARVADGYYFDDAEMSGEHGGLSVNQSMVPLVFAGPGIKHGVNSTRVSNVDIAPTIASLLGFNMSSADGSVLSVEVGEECGDSTCSSAPLRPLETTDSCNISQGVNRYYKLDVTYPINVFLDVPDSSNFDLYVYSDCAPTHYCSSTNATGEDDYCDITSAGTYYVRVYSNSGSGEYDLSYGVDCDDSNKPDILEHDIDICAPNTPELRRPENDSTITNITVNDEPVYNALDFLWSYPTDPGGSGIKDFTINVSNSLETVYYSTVKQNTHTLYDLGEDTYYWKVRTRDNKNNVSNWSETFQVFLDDIMPPIAPIMYVVSAGWKNSGDPYNVSWEPALDPSGISGYHFQEDNDSDFSSPITDIYTTELNFSAPSGRSSGTYYYRVSANDTTGSNWSSWSTGHINVANGEVTFKKRLENGWNLVSIPLSLEDGGEKSGGGGGDSEKESLKDTDSKKEGGSGGEKDGGGSGCTVYNLSQGIAANGSDSPPSLRDYYGYALVNGSLVDDGSNISVFVNGSDEHVGMGLSCSNGEYVVEVILYNYDNDTDGNAMSTDVLYFQINGENVTYAEKTAKTIDGLFNDYLLGVGDVPTKIVDHEPTSSTPSVKVTKSLNFTVDAVDQNTWSLTYLWLLDGETQAITGSWTYAPNAFEVGERNVTVIVNSDTDYDSFEWTVTVDPQCSGSYPYPIGDWNVTENTTCEDTEIGLQENASVIVNTGDTLRLDNTTVNITSTQDNQSIIIVRGVLEVIDSVIRFFD